VIVSWPCCVVNSKREYDAFRLKIDLILVRIFDSGINLKTLEGPRISERSMQRHLSHNLWGRARDFRLAML